jgi:hypothetical protein
MVGGWHDKETDTVWLDLVRVYAADQRDLAVRMGKRKNQIAIADLGAIAKGQWDQAIIPTGGTGAAVSKQVGQRPRWVLFDLDTRAADIVAAFQEG